MARLPSDPICLRAPPGASVRVRLPFCIANLQPWLPSECLSFSRARDSLTVQINSRRSTISCLRNWNVRIKLATRSRRGLRSSIFLLLLLFRPNARLYDKRSFVSHRPIVSIKIFFLREGNSMNSAEFEWKDCRVPCLERFSHGMP